LSNSSHLAELNHKFRAKNQPTNVLSFPDEEQGGDIAVAIDIVSSEADQQGATLHQMVAMLVTHATLHLASFHHEHESDYQTMLRLERQVLSKMSLDHPFD
tara:strand:+ start:364 stop:666 length:303 start_codon:yes stop_codon:yes gene_type:complete